MIKCEICGEGLAEYQCPMCGKWICPDCWDFEEDLCVECVADIAAALKM